MNPETLKDMKNVGSGVLKALGSMFGSLFGAKTQLDSQKELFKYSQDLTQNSWKEQFNMMNDRQDWLLQNQASQQLQGLRKAGLSDSMINGMPNVAGSASTSGTSGSFGSSSNPFEGFIASEQMRMQRDLNRANVENIRANTNKTNAEKEALERENKINKDYDNWLSQNNIDADLLKEFFGEEFARNYDELVSKSADGYEIADVDIRPITQGFLRALNEMRLNDVNKAEYESRKELASFNEALYHAQHYMPEVFNAHVNLTLADYRQLLEGTAEIKKKIESLGKDIELKDLEIQEFENTKIGPVLNKLLSSDAGPLDKATAFFGWFINSWLSKRR